MNIRRLFISNTRLFQFICNPENVVDFLKVLKLYENDIFGDAYYDLHFRKNVKNKKPFSLPKGEDVQLLLDECSTVMNSIDTFDLPGENFVDIRAATATTLITFNAR